MREPGITTFCASVENLGNLRDVPAASSLHHPSTAQGEVYEHVRSDPFGVMGVSPITLSHTCPRKAGLKFFQLTLDSPADLVGRDSNPDGRSVSNTHNGP